MINPISPVYETAKYWIEQSQDQSFELVPIATDAKIQKDRKKNKIVILILGETARSDHFSLNGYKDNHTNPELEKLNIVSFNNVTSCGTATATSVPCMFSDLGSKKFDVSFSETRENLLDVARRTGYQVKWIDNNTGCMGICGRIENIDLSPLKTPQLCPGATCYDEILLEGLKKSLSPDQDQLIVLHMLGSHGPSYYQRYPKAFLRFLPSCETNDLSQCTQEQVRNTYDNTILYTDFVVSQIIKFVDQTFKNAEKAVIYVSDHGESLGENGIYLHSLPFLIAPKAQKHVPLVFWFDEGFRQQNKRAVQNLSAIKDCGYSHDFLFSTMLTLLDIKTDAYVPMMDLLKNSSQSCVGAH